MSTDFNKCILEGRLTSDAEKITVKDFIIAKFSIACNKTKKINNEYTDTVSFFDVASIVSEKQLNFMKKGIHVLIEAEAKQNRWKADGKTNSRIVFEAKTIKFLNSSSQTSELDGSESIPDVINYDDIQIDTDSYFG